MTHLCEVCKIEEVEIAHESVLGIYQVCKKCDETLRYIREEEFIAFADIPRRTRNVFPSKWCGGWDTENHNTTDTIIYLVVSKDNDLVGTNIMKFCRSCFIEYANDDTFDRLNRR